MNLPGGVLHAGVLHREARFAPLDGRVELALAEAVSAPSIAEGVTRVLATALDGVGELAFDAGAGAPVRLRACADLSVGDRQFLMRALAVALGLDRLWLTAACSACGERFDVPVDQSAMPVKAAQPGYPFVDVRCGRLRVRARAPTGADQAAVSRIADPVAARAALRARLLVQVDGGQAGALGDAHWRRIEAAVEQMSPEVSEEALTACPQCGAQQRVYVDPYACVWSVGDALFDEVHRIASHYHWAEHDILALPRERRQRYLALIERTAVPAAWPAERVWP